MKTAKVHAYVRHEIEAGTVDAEGTITLTVRLQVGRWEGLRSFTAGQVRADDGGPPSKRLLEQTREALAASIDKQQHAAQHDADPRLQLTEREAFAYLAVRKASTTGYAKTLTHEEYMRLKVAAGELDEEPGTQPASTIDLIARHVDDAADLARGPQLVPAAGQYLQERIEVLRECVEAGTIGSDEWERMAEEMGPAQREGLRTYNGTRE